MTATETDVMMLDDRPLPSLLEISLDAALELEDLSQGNSEQAPTLLRLVEILKEGKPVITGAPISMLSDVRGIALVRRALAQSDAESDTDRSKLKDLITSYLDKLVADANAKSKSGIKEAKRFCLALNQELLKRQHEKLTSRRWRQESAA